MQVVVIMSVLSVGIYFLSSRINQQKNLVLSSNTVLQVHIGLQSIMDYAYALIQHRYCLTELLTPAANCNLNMAKGGTTLTAPGGGWSSSEPGNARSIERILLSKEQADNMAAMINVNCIDLGLEAPYQPVKSAGGVCVSQPQVQNDSFQTFVNTIDIKLPAGDISAAHPLYNVIAPILKAMRSDLYDANSNQTVPLVVHVTISRDTSMNLLRTGTEVYFTVKVKLEDNNGKLLSINNKQIPLEVASYGTVYPREIGSFAMLVANDLHLDGGGSASLGDFVVPPTGGTGGTVAGVVFKSPVFVNGQVWVPNVPASLGGNYNGYNNKYSPVTFGDRVIVGNGIVNNGADVYNSAMSSAYVPQTAGGGQDLLWSDNRLFGGFKMGVSIDSAYDNGLTTMASLNLGSSDFSLMNQCLTRNAANSDLNLIGTSSMYASLTDSGHSSSVSPGPASSFTYVLGIVNPQNAAFGSLSSILFNSQTAALGPVVNGGNASWGGVQLQGAPNNGAVAAVRVLMGDPANGPPQEADANLAVGNQLVLTDVLTNSPLSTAMSTSTNTAATTAFQTALANPATITVSIEGFTPPQGNNASPVATSTETSVIALHVSATNPKSLYDPNDATGTAFPPVQIDVTGFDLRYQNNAPASLDTKKRANADYSTHRRFVFTNPQDGINLTAPQNVLSPVLSADKMSTSWPNPSVAAQIVQNPYASGHPPYDNTGFNELAALCEANSGRGTNQSFGAAKWNVSFSSDSLSTRHSWNFASPGGQQNSFVTNGTATQPVGEVLCDGNDNPQPIPTLDTTSPRYAGCNYVFTRSNSAMPGVNNVPNPIQWVSNPGSPPTAINLPGGYGRSDFKVMSIVKDCEIQGDADLVAAFLICDNLTIDARTTPLTMIGTFVAKNLVIDPSAVKAGITVMSIYHPDATQVLRAAGILRTTNPKPDGSLPPCSDQITGKPIWDQSSPTTAQKMDSTSCNVLWLRSKAQPFQWTAVDPDCGTPPNTSNTVCKHHPVNFFVTEQGRGGGP